MDQHRAEYINSRLEEWITAEQNTSTVEQREGSTLEQNTSTVDEKNRSTQSRIHTSTKNKRMDQH
jgi:hypothetical protein